MDEKTDSEQALYRYINEIDESPPRESYSEIFSLLDEYKKSHSIADISLKYVNRLTRSIRNIPTLTRLLSEYFIDCDAEVFNMFEERILFWISVYDTGFPGEGVELCLRYAMSVRKHNKENILDILKRQDDKDRFNSKYDKCMIIGGYMKDRRNGDSMMI